MRPDAEDHAQARGVRLAARGVARHGLVNAYGHVSSRIDGERFLVSAPQPLGTIGIGDPGVVVPIAGPLPDGALPEVRMHREIYRLRPNAGGVCRLMPPSVMALSALGETPRALHGMGAYFAPRPPLWSDPQLVRDDPRALHVAAALGSAAAIVLRGNGALTVGATIEEAAVLGFYLEDAARLELALLAAPAAGKAPMEFTAEEAANRAVKVGALFERMWQFLCFGDPEWATP